jgi:pimeloyl-ACP methyl ester carboxylesterase
MSAPGSTEPEVVEVDGVAISYRVSGRPEGSTVLLIHGGAAHAGWWEGVAPRLAGEYRVVVAELSGHGRSGHREAYGAEPWAAEMAAVLRRTTDRPAAVVGHSMGGLVGLATAARTPELVETLVLLDSRLPLLGLPLSERPARLFGSAEEALDRFRLLPAQTAADPALLRRVAEEGLVRTEDGWRWRFDPRVRRRFTNEGVQADLAVLSCPVGYLYGADSDMGGPVSHDYLETHLGRPVPLRAIPGAFHHVPLDRPAACAEALAETLATLTGSRA